MLAELEIISAGCGGIVEKIRIGHAFKSISVRESFIAELALLNHNILTYVLNFHYNQYNYVMYRTGFSNFPFINNAIQTT
jgi:hypothetical protein